MFPALFMDRDGVIIEYRKHYVRSWSDVVIYPSALAALAKVKDSPYKVVIITNQSAVGRGIISLNAAIDINKRLVDQIIKGGGKVDRIFMCPHKPEDNCQCRKPKPGLIIQAAEELKLDLPNSVLIGDALSDLEAGQVAGVGKLILVRTGRGRQEELRISKSQIKNILVADSLWEVFEQFIRL